MTDTLTVILLGVCALLSLVAAVAAILALSKAGKGSSEPVSKLRSDVNEGLAAQRREVLTYAREALGLK